MNSASICSPSRGTSCTRRRASGRCTSAAACKLEPLIHGAGHESGRRAGTENVPYIVGLGKAARSPANRCRPRPRSCKRLRDRLHEKLQAALGEQLVLNGHPEQRLPNTLNVSFVGHIGSELLAKVPGVAASTGSACHEGKIARSPVLCAMGVPPGSQPRRGATDGGPFHDRGRGGPGGGDTGQCGPFVDDKPPWTVSGFV